MYGYFREFWHMTTRQGLQVGGVGSGVVMLIFQVEMMWHDYSANNVSSNLFPNVFLSFSYIQWEADVSDGSTDYRLSRLFERWKRGFKQ